MIENSAGNVTLAGKNGHHIVSDVQDLRVAITDDDLTSAITESIDTLDEHIAEVIDAHHGDALEFDNIQQDSLFEI